ncbi:hypothetical protein UG55_1022104 [Frankia sp. EI5c]|uniref:hypothetical protein n=1 Tax=Frankia sp. EI5c TaxID=683316 RepID=UPI0007C2E0E5|nr:hypothetical protein [Frankia sp. EI5c]OAA25444.1 hypothetical protein UG55_1022104 [Frankia sp. EI5c]
MSARQIRRFHIERDVDVSGVSGTGAVAYGVQAPDGTCVLWWNSDHGSVALYPSMATLLAIHGHGGMTRAVYIDDPVVTDRPAAAPTGSARGWRVPGGTGARAGRSAPARAAGGRARRTRATGLSWEVATRSITARAAARGGIARVLPAQANGRKHGAVGPSGSMV